MKFLKGLLGGIAGGISSALGLAVAMPENLDTSPAGLKRLGLFVLFVTLTHALAYISKSPFLKSE